MTTVYLSWNPGAHQTLIRHYNDRPVDLLVAYQYLKEFLKRRHKYNVNKWIIDSGAFTVWKTGKVIDLHEYMAMARDTDAQEIVMLDVIGGTVEQNMRNAEIFLSAGLRQMVVSVCHDFYGQARTGRFTRTKATTKESWRYLAWCAERFEKVGLAPKCSGKWQWLEQAFARIWPKKTHGFALASKEALSCVPFHSVDASSWTYAPFAMGHWAGFTGKQMWLRSTGVRDVWCEVEEHFRRADWAAHRWRRELALLEEPGVGKPTVRQIR